MNWYGYVLLTIAVIELGCLVVGIWAVALGLDAFNDVAKYFKKKVNDKEPGTFKDD